MILHFKGSIVEGHVWPECFPLGAALLRNSVAENGVCPQVLPYLERSKTKKLSFPQQ